MLKTAHVLQYNNGDKPVVSNMSEVLAMNRKYARNKIEPPATGEVVHYVKGTDSAGDTKTLKAVVVDLYDVEQWRENTVHCEQNELKFVVCARNGCN